MLDGLRVIEIADEQAEYAGLVLAGLGAEVIKVEPPGGNSTRRIGPFYEGIGDPERSLFFWHYNRAKRSDAAPRSARAHGRSARPLACACSPPRTSSWSRPAAAISTGSVSRRRSCASASRPS